MTPKLYLLTQSVAVGYDTYDSMVVVAKSAEQARSIAPTWDDAIELFPNGRWLDLVGDWASHPDHVTSKFLGRAAPRTACPSIVLKSFNAG